MVDSDDNNGQFIARKNGDEAMEGQNIVEGEIVYNGEFDDVEIQSSLVALYGRLKNGGKEDFGSSDWWSATYGATLEISGISFGASVGTDHLGDQDHQFMTAGIGYTFGEVSTSITYGWVWDFERRFFRGEWCRQAAQPRVLGRLRPGPRPGPAGRRGAFRQRHQREL